MQMQAAGSKPSQPKAEAAVAAKPEPAAAGKRPAAAASRKTAVTADAGTPEEPPVAGDASGISTMEDLMLGNWSRNEQPVAWLPSSINNCRTEQNRIVCFSGDQVRESGNNTVKFKTKAIISHFSAAGAFNVTYRNLVLSAVSKEPASIGEVAAFDEALEEKGYTVRTGWGKEHTLECLMSDSHAVNCTKNKIQALALVNQQQVAGSR
jgi:hypothetical protein